MSQRDLDRYTALSAADVRDFAHLAIAFCRSLGIPARFVSAYAYGLNPPDFHAYIEAFVGGRWILFDPTRLAPQSSFMRIGHGRDAADTSFATIFGGAVMNKMELSMKPTTGQLSSPQYTTAPISNYPSAASSEKQSLAQRPETEGARGIGPAYQVNLPKLQHYRIPLEETSFKTIVHGAQSEATSTFSRNMRCTSLPRPQYLEIYGSEQRTEFDGNCYIEIATSKGVLAYGERGTK
jgi:Transglutaminase-like superfamily